ncbi:MAG TPA: aminoglycoside 6-adenylyltransferase [Thermoplasmata archaeon]|nr:aminoglycoside 6-adenylyltransferase [Thermoplasmata archaeon]
MWARWYGPFVEKFRTWAENERGVRAALIVGSQARTEAPADEWSDLDLVVFHTDPPELIESTDWFQPFGTVVLSIVEPTAVGGSRERRVLYADGRDVDFAIFPAAAIPFLARSPEGLSVLGRGFAILVDKDRGFAELRATARSRASRTSGLPTKGEFQADVSDFYYHLLWFAKKLRRGETWLAKMGCDGYLKLLLARMIEWSTVASSSGRVDVWHDGRFLDRWAPSRVKSQLAATFAQYEAHDVSRALRETGQLYGELARQVAGQFGWSYPAEAEEMVTGFVQSTLASLPPPP